MTGQYDTDDFRVVDDLQKEILDRFNAMVMSAAMDAAGALVVTGMREDQACTATVHVMIHTAAALAVSVALTMHDRKPERERWERATAAAFDYVASQVKDEAEAVDAG